MRSRADIRGFAEWIARAIALAAIAVALWRSTRPAALEVDVRRMTPATIPGALTYVLGAQGDVAYQLTMDRSLSRPERDLLAALRRAGIAVHWQGEVPPLAIEVVRTREPVSGARIGVLGGGATAVALADSAGPLDTVRTTTGTTLDVETLVGIVKASQGKFVARTPTPRSVARRAVMVLGRAGWEAKFVMSALTEAGWVVRARIPAAPGVVVHDDALLPLDTSRYEAVVALDSSAADLTSDITRFVAQGGGLVTSASALTLGTLRALIPVRVGDRRPGRILLAADTVTPPDLPMRPLTSLASDAITLERGRTGATLVARRVGSGRVLVVGYDESWRWRMLGGASGVAAHRSWWSRAVGSVAPEREETLAPDNADAAPRVALVQSLGPPSSARVLDGHSPLGALPLLILIVAIAALLAETASRRLRGAR